MPGWITSYYTVVVGLRSKVVVGVSNPLFTTKGLKSYSSVTTNFVLKRLGTVTSTWLDKEDVRKNILVLGVVEIPVLRSGK